MHAVTSGPFGNEGFKVCGGGCAFTVVRIARKNGLSIRGERVCGQAHLRENRCLIENFCLNDPFPKLFFKRKAHRKLILDDARMARMGAHGEHETIGHMIAPANHDAYSRVVKLRHAGDRHRGLMGFDNDDPNVLEGNGGAAVVHGDHQ